MKVVIEQSPPQSQPYLRRAREGEPGYKVSEAQYVLHLKHLADSVAQEVWIESLRAKGPANG